MKKYFLQLISLLLFLTAAEILILGDRYFNWILSVPCFFLLVGVLAYFVMQKINNDKRFLTYFLVLVFAKMLLCATVVAVYLIFVKEQKTIFAVVFLINYIVFTIFETYIFLNINKSVSGGKQAI
jgi:bacteriorhodopsin